MPHQLPDATLDPRATGVHLVPGRLRDPLQGGPHLLVLLRPCGGTFSRETLAELRVAAEGVRAT